ncbi:MAG: YMGG-like glycine zipper-containing protein [Nitrospinota bacterium]
MSALKVVAPILVVALILTGCATKEGKVSDKTKTRVGGTAAGAVLGGVLGAVLGGKKGAIIGAAIGAGAGYLVGNEIARRKGRYATEEAFLDSEIKTAAQFNQTASKYNGQLKTQLVELDTASKKLKARYDAGKASRRDLQAKRKEIAGKIGQTKKLHGDLKKEYDIKVAVYEEQRKKRAGSDGYVVSLGREIRQLEENIAALQAGSVQLAKIDERLTG